MKRHDVQSVSGPVERVVPEHIELMPGVAGDRACG